MEERQAGAPVEPGASGTDVEAVAGATGSGPPALLPPLSPAPPRSKLTAKVIPFSSIVGGGVALLDAHGRIRFQIALLGCSHGISKLQSDDMAHQLAFLINELGLDAIDA